MKVRNPSYVDPITTWVAANKAAVQTWFAAPAQAAKQFITAEEIRIAFPALSAQLTDGTIAEICKTLGIEVLPD